MQQRLFIFNPDCEMAIANGSRYYMPPANIARMADDLLFLPAFLGENGDGVWMKNELDAEFTKEVYLRLQIKCRVVTKLKDGEGWQAEPWGWSPKMAHWLQKKGYGKEWDLANKEWYSRKMAQLGMRLLANRLSFVDAELLPLVCESLEEIESNVLGEQSYLAKAPWSSSGKGLLNLAGKVGEKEREWLGGILKRQGYVMLEKRVDKVTDFAMEFCASESAIEFIGWSFFTVGENGEYRGNYIGCQEKIEQDLSELVDFGQLMQLKGELISVLKEVLPDYRGYFGVDMMIYRDAQGEMRIHPCVEINLRYNMGIVALYLSRNYLDEGSCGEFTISYFPHVGDALAAHSLAKEEAPVIYKDNRIKSGYLNLTPITASTSFVAFIRCY